MPCGQPHACPAGGGLPQGTGDAGQVAPLGGRSHSRRFGDLFNLVCDLDFLAEAWLRVKGNAGSRTPGIDKATVADIENRIGVGAFLEQIRDSLKSGEFRPEPVRQVMIPKKSGKLRKLGIATVADRVVQAALKLVLEPIFEADFQPCSYGFRPNRRAHDAIAEIQFFATHGLRLGAGGRHPGLLRRNRACPPDGPAPGQDQGQAGIRAGQGVPQSRGHDGRRRPGRDIHRHPHRRDTLPAAGQHRAVRAG